MFRIPPTSLKTTELIFIVLSAQLQWLKLSEINLVNYNFIPKTYVIMVTVFEGFKQMFTQLLYFY